MAGSGWPNQHCTVPLPWSSGAYKAAVHRVLVPEAGGRPDGRLSLAFFYEPSLDVVVKPLKGGSDEDGRYPPCTFGDFLKWKFSTTGDEGERVVET